MQYFHQIVLTQELFYRHEGVLFPNQMVLHASKDRAMVVLEPFSVFAKGKTVNVRCERSKFSVAEIVSRSRKFLGRPYNPVRDNCEHLISDLLETKKGSPQLKLFLIAVFAVGGLLLSRRA